MQLGVVSGKRKRRDTDIVSGPDLNNLYDKPVKEIDNEHTAIDIDNTKVDYKQRMLQWSLFKDTKPNNRTAGSNNSIRKRKDLKQYGDDDKYVPVPLQIKHP